MSVNHGPVELTTREFEKICELVRSVCGIHLQEGKEGLVRTRLSKRISELKLSSFQGYIDRVAADPRGQEMSCMVDLLTTNKTEFFRENAHFTFLRSVWAETNGAAPSMRLWSAGCSTGEEPYSLAILIREVLRGKDVKILATDISSKVLAVARKAVYPSSALSSIDPELRRKYFAPETKGSNDYRVNPVLVDLVRFARLNLMAAWPMKGPFDAVFCRNVMIYFNRQDQERLVNRFWDILSPGGYLFIGHSESLNVLKHRFSYVRPAVYVK